MTETHEVPPRNESPDHHRTQKPLQFRLRTLLALGALVAVLFSALAWLGVPPEGQLIVLAILGLGIGAAVALLVAIAGNSNADEPDDPR